MQITSGIIRKPIKCVIYGPEGVGKSSFAARAPFPLWCDVEASSEELNVRRLPKPTSYQAIMDQIRHVCAHPEVCDTFVLDTADWAERLCQRHVCANGGKQSIEDFGYGRGFTIAYEAFGALLNMLEELIARGINVIVTAHAAMRRVELPDEDGSYDRWEMKLCNSQKCSVAGMLKEWADIVLFANYKTYVIKKDSKDKTGKAKGGQQRVMYTTHHACWDAKNRHGLADELPFDFGQVAHLFLAKSAVQAKSEVPARDCHVGADAPPRNDMEREYVTASIVPGEGMPSPYMGAERDGGPARDAGVSVPYSGESEVPARGTSRTPSPTGAEDTSGEDKYTKAYPFDEVLPDGIITPLADLMRMHTVTQAELQAVVAQKGYFPADVPVAQYPQDFQNFLTTVWPQVLDVIKTNRTKEN